MRCNDWGPPPDLPPEAYAEYVDEPPVRTPARTDPNLTPKAEVRVPEVFAAGQSVPDIDEALDRAVKVEPPKTETQAVGWGTYRRLIDQGVDRRTALDEAVRALRGEGGEPW